MSTIIVAIVSLLASIAPLVTNNGSIAKIIQTLTDLIPLIVKEISDIVPMVKNIIAALKGNPEVTQEQIDSLDQMSAKLDAEFDAAAAAAQAEDGTTPKV